LTNHDISARKGKALESPALSRVAGAAGSRGWWAIARVAALSDREPLTLDEHDDRLVLSDLI